jgi:hypothetical protein
MNSGCVSRPSQGRHWLNMRMNSASALRSTSSDLPSVELSSGWKSEGTLGACQPKSKLRLRVSSAPTGPTTDTTHGPTEPSAVGDCRDSQSHHKPGSPAVHTQGRVPREGPGPGSIGDRAAQVRQRGASWPTASGRPGERPAPASVDRAAGYPPRPASAAEATSKLRAPGDK